MTITVRVLKFPSIGKEEEFDALAAEPDVDLRWVGGPEEIGAADLVILPGSEATLADLQWMRDTGIEQAVRDAALRGSMLFGICGGLQIMGTRLQDPERIEGGATSGEGMGLLPISTTFTRDVVDEPSVGTGRGGLVPESVVVRGFELHGGRSILDDPSAVTSLFDEPTKGGGACPLAIATHDLAAIGTYLHGILEDAGFRAALLERLRARRARESPRPSVGDGARDGRAQIGS